jgi:hypothetical protein
MLMLARYILDWHIQHVYRSLGMRVNTLQHRHSPIPLLNARESIQTTNNARNSLIRVECKDSNNLRSHLDNSHLLSDGLKALPRYPTVHHRKHNVMPLFHMRLDPRNMSVIRSRLHVRKEREFLTRSI